MHSNFCKQTKCHYSIGPWIKYFYRLVISDCNPVSIIYWGESKSNSKPINYSLHTLRTASCLANSINKKVVHSNLDLKGETGYVTYLSWKCSILEKNFRIHLILMRHFYGVQFLNRSVNSVIIFHHLFQPISSDNAGLAY